MKLTPSKINKFLLFKLPSAYLSGVRLKEITQEIATVTVKHRWINQNPFKSLYWATQGMASELATGVLVIQEIETSGEKISMLVRSQKGTFTSSISLDFSPLVVSRYSCPEYSKPTHCSRVCRLQQIDSSLVHD